MKKKLIILIAILSSLNATVLENEEISFEPDANLSSTNLDKQIVSSINLKTDENITKQEIKEEENLTQKSKYAENIYIHGGTSLKNKFIVGNKFISKDRVINSLNDNLNAKFKNPDSNSTKFDSSLSYKIYKFSIEKNHEKFWVDAIIEYKLTDLEENKTSKSNKIFKKYKSNLTDDEIYEDALETITTEIYKNILKDNKNQAKEENIKEEKDLVKQNSKGGVILPFD